jgi:hypothetical protein
MRKGTGGLGVLLLAGLGLGMLRDTAAPGGRSLGAVEGPKKSLAVEEPADTKIPSPPLKCQTING